MRVSRVGLTPLKGGRHRTLRAVTLAAGGPVGDRVFFLLDPGTGRALRTVENPRLLATGVDWDGRVLTAALPGLTVAGEPVASGAVREVDYWERTVRATLVDGPWAAAYADHLGREVVLARAEPGDVVYGAPVSLVTSGSVARLAREAGRPVDARRFRATVEVDADAHVEDGWVGRRLRIGEAEVRVVGAVPRCAVIDLDPDSGTRDQTLLRTLAGYRRAPAGVLFGVDAEVTVPGVVRPGDRVRPADPVT